MSRLLPGLVAICVVVGDTCLVFFRYSLGKRGGAFFGHFSFGDVPFSFVELVGVYGQAWVAVLPVVVVLLPGLDAEAAHRSFCQRFLCLSVNHLVDTHGS